MHALRKAHSEANADPVVMETDRLILCPTGAQRAFPDTQAFDFTVLAKADRRLVARMTFAAARGQEARLTMSLGVGADSPDLMAEAAKVVVPMAMAALGARVLRAAADIGDQAMIGVLRRFGMQARGGPSSIRAGVRTIQFEKDLCGIM